MKTFFFLRGVGWGLWWPVCLITEYTALKDIAYRVYSYISHESVLAQGKVKNCSWWRARWGKWRELFFKASFPWQPQLCLRFVLFFSFLFLLHENFLKNETRWRQSGPEPHSQIWFTTNSIIDSRSCGRSVSHSLRAPTQSASRNAPLTPLSALKLKQAVFFFKTANLFSCSVYM